MLNCRGNRPSQPCERVRTRKDGRQAADFVSAGNPPTRASVVSAMGSHTWLRRLAILVLMLAAFVATGVPGAAESPLYLVVPLGEPGDTDPLVRNATNDLVADLSERRIRTAIATPVDAIEAVGAAAKLCAEYRASGLLVGQLKFEQRKDRNLTGFIPVIGGAVSASGAFDSSPLRARVKLFLIDCNGHVQWRTMASADKVHHGTNVAAGLTQIMDIAIHDAVDQFANRR